VEIQTDPLPDNSPSCAEEAPRVLAPSSFSTGLLPNATISIIVEFHAKTCVSKAPIENGAVDFSLNSEYFEEQPSEQPFDQNKNGSRFDHIASY
jgi:hypothetical protein